MTYPHENAQNRRYNESIDIDKSDLEFLYAILFSFFRKLDSLIRIRSLAEAGLSTHQSNQNTTT